MSGLSGSEASSPLPRLLAVAVLVLGMAVSFTVVPGVFSVDDNNYLINVLALRQGRFTVANTEGLSPSRELLFFDPAPSARAVDSTPVGSTAPPLYALLALPFLPFGWRGLVALNTLAYLATTVMVFLYTRRYATETSTAWMAAAAFALGGFVIEYAQGVWPHALSIALCTGGILAAGRSIESRDPGIPATTDVRHWPPLPAFYWASQPGSGTRTRSFWPSSPEASRCGAHTGGRR